jgi:hypothetical protein
MKLPFKKYAPSKNYGWIITIRKLLSEIKIYTKSIAYVGWTVRKLRAGSKRITVDYHAIVGQRMRRGGCSSASCLKVVVLGFFFCENEDLSVADPFLLAGVLSSGRLRR